MAGLYSVVNYKRTMSAFERTIILYRIVLYLVVTRNEMYSRSQH